MSNISEYTEQDNMIFADVTVLAQNMMNDHGLIEKGWYFSWDRAKKRMGCCNYSLKQITMSRILTPSRPMHEIKNTILHEIAHALVGHSHGHNEVWRAKAIEIGCTGDRCSANSGERPEFTWYSICDHCDNHVGMHRAPGRVRSCGKCAPWGFSWQHMTSWTKNGETAYLEDMPEKFQREYNLLRSHYA